MTSALKMEENSLLKNSVYVVIIINFMTNEERFLTNYDNEVVLFDNRFDAIDVAKTYIRPFVEKFAVYMFDYQTLPTGKYRKYRSKVKVDEK